MIREYAVKAGFSLRLDDLPDHYDKKQEVIDWESFQPNPLSFISKRTSLQMPSD